MNFKLKTVSISYFGQGAVLKRLRDAGVNQQAPSTNPVRTDCCLTSWPLGFYLITMWASTNCCFTEKASAIPCLSVWRWENRFFMDLWPPRVPSVFHSFSIAIWASPVWFLHITHCGHGARQKSGSFDGRIWCSYMQPPKLPFFLNSVFSKVTQFSQALAACSEHVSFSETNMHKIGTSVGPVVEGSLYIDLSDSVLFAPYLHSLQGWSLHNL